MNFLDPSNQIIKIIAMGKFLEPNSLSCAMIVQRNRQLLGTTISTRARC
jgi:hypothetical protein